VQTDINFCLVYFTALVVCHIRKPLSPINGWTECCSMKCATFVSERENNVLQWELGHWIWIVLQSQQKIWKSSSQKLSTVSYIIKSLKEVMNPYMINTQIFLHFWGCGIILCGGDNKSNKIFKLQKRAIQIIGGVSKHAFFRQIFKDYNIFTVTSLCILEVVCWIKKYEDSQEHIVHLYTYNMPKKWNYMCNLTVWKSSGNYTPQ